MRPCLFVSISFWTIFRYRCLRLICDRCAGDDDGGGKIVKARCSVVPTVTFSSNLLHSDGSRHRVAATVLVVRRSLHFLPANNGSELPVMPRHRVAVSTTELARSEFSPARHDVGGGAGLPARMTPVMLWRKGRSNSEDGGREAVESMAKMAKKNDLILRSSGAINVDGSRNFAYVFSKR
nr:probable protein phosphatase 2C 34 [Ipomoea batatas]